MPRPKKCRSVCALPRTTVQQIYARARKKLADALVCGLPLRIAGGGDGSFIS